MVKGHTNPVSLDIGPWAPCFATRASGMSQVACQLSTTLSRTTPLCRKDPGRRSRGGLWHQTYGLGIGELAFNLAIHHSLENSFRQLHALTDNCDAACHKVTRKVMRCVNGLADWVWSADRSPAGPGRFMSLFRSESVRGDKILWTWSWWATAGVGREVGL